MTDFDAVLERLLTDPSFQAQLAADPVGALAGYDLDAEEAGLLCQQVSTDAGAHTAAVEDRVTKSSTFGLLSSFGIGEVAGSVGSGMTRQGFGPAPMDGPAGAGSAALGSAGFSAADTAATSAGPAAVDSAAAGSAGTDAGGLGEWSEFGSAVGAAAQAAAGYPATGHSAVEGLGSAPEAWGAGGGDMTARSGLGSAPEFSARTGLGAAPGREDGLDLDGLPAVAGLGDAPRSGLGDAGQAQGGSGEAEQPAPPKGYHNRVDADGDGSLDEATYRGREGGGAEIRVDLDGDGRADFVGVDKDLDNRVDFADYDKDHDGVFEKRMFDDDGDGFLDRTVWQ
jgi:hypothetical protein